MNDQKNPWTILEEKQVYENNWIRLTEFEVINPNGGQGIYGKVHFKNIAVGVVPIDDEGNTWLIGQYRFTLNEYSWEIPEGGGELNDDPLQSAQRELLEEAGLVAKNWSLILKMHTSNSVTDEVALIYLATGIEEKEPSPEETEKLAVKKIPLTTAFEWVEDGKITDSMSVAALQRIQLMRLREEISI